MKQMRDVLCGAHAPVDNGINGDIANVAVAPCVGRWLYRVILRRWETTATDRATVRDCPGKQRLPIRMSREIGPRKRRPEIVRFNVRLP